MAKLLKHPLDFCGLCPSPKCLGMHVQDYNGEQVLWDGAIVSARMYTCAGCQNTYVRDVEPMPGAKESDLGRVVDLRSWAALRVARMRGLAANQDANRSGFTAHRETGNPDAGHVDPCSSSAVRAVGYSKPGQPGETGTDRRSA